MAISGKFGQGLGKVGSGIQKGYGGAKRAGGAAIAGGSFMGGLALGAAGKAKKNSGTFVVILAFSMFLFDTIVGYKGFYITSVDSFWEIGRAITSLAYVIGVWALFYYFVSKDRSPRALLSWVIVLIVLMISTGIAFRLNPMAITHVGFILLLWFFFIRGREDAVAANWILVGLLVVDLYLYSIVNIFSPATANNIAGIPILFSLTLVYVYQQTNNKLALILMICVVGWYFIIAGPALAEKLNLAGIEGIRTRIPSLSDIITIGKEKLVNDPTKKLRDAAGAWLSDQIQYAITGKVEENKYEPLGVYLENIQSAEPSYFEDENVIIWGTVKVKTLDKEGGIGIKLGCYVKEEGKTRDYKNADKVDPLTFQVYDYEEQDFVCTFNKCCEPKDTPEECKKKRANCKLKDGSNTITTFADFNFETLAYLKTYFIDNTRKRAMVREGLDIFGEYEIKDKNPVAVYTNGPVEIGMETTDLVGVGNDVKPYLSITLQNRAGWEGKITNLKELTVFFPLGAYLDNGYPENPPCNKNFIEDKDKSKCEKDLCGGPKEKGGLEKDVCLDLCKSFTGWSLDLNDEDVQRDLNEGFEKFKFFRCRFNPVADKVLGNTPITTKFFRVKAEYDYSVEKPVIVNIKKIPEPVGTTTSTPGATPTTQTTTTPGSTGTTPLAGYGESCSSKLPCSSGYTCCSECNKCYNTCPNALCCDSNDDCPSHLPQCNLGAKVCESAVLG